jgi:hypothetical protein
MSKFSSLIHPLWHMYYTPTRQAALSSLLYSAIENVSGLLNILEKIF